MARKRCWKLAAAAVLVGGMLAPLTAAHADPPGPTLPIVFSGFPPGISGPHVADLQVSFDVPFASELAAYDVGSVDPFYKLALECPRRGYHASPTSPVVASKVVAGSPVKFLSWTLPSPILFPAVVGPCDVRATTVPGARQLFGVALGRDTYWRCDRDRGSGGWTKECSDAFDLYLAHLADSAHIDHFTFEQDRGLFTNLPTPMVRHH